MANKNDFKPFAIGAGANVTPQADWEALAALDAGFQSGKASSAQVNKALRQGTFVASALAQFISNKLAADVIDDGDLSGFVTDFINAIKAQSLTRDNPFADIKADGTVNTALENLGFAGSLTSPGYAVIPLGTKKLVIQWGTVTVPIAGSTSATYLLALDLGLAQFCTPIDVSSVNNYRVGVATSTNTSITLTSTNTQSVTGVMWLSIGTIN
ncbi:hypothetical protein D2C60_21225 [Escherichia coli]|nr:hypothetical protein [Escherichia coli]